MTKYTVDEIVEDINQTEGINFGFKTEMLVFSGVLYSQIYSKMSDNSTVSELNNKIQNFLTEHCYPALSGEPDSREDYLTVYSVLIDPEHKVPPSSAKKEGSFKRDDVEQFAVILESLNESCVILIDNNCEKISCYHRCTH